MIGEPDDPNRETIFEFYDCDLTYITQDDTDEIHHAVLCAAYGGHYRDGTFPIVMRKDHTLDELKSYLNHRYQIRYAEPDIIISLIDKKTRLKIAEHIKVH